MPSIEKIFWLIAIGITCLNAYLLHSRAREKIARNPELAHGYRQLVKGFLIWLNLPWLVMGLGIMVGGVPSVFDYFYPHSGNLFVIAFHATMIVLGALQTFWIYFAGGAEFLVRHPGVWNVDIRSPMVLKLLFALMLLGGVVAEIVMWSNGLRVPNNVR